MIHLNTFHLFSIKTITPLPTITLSCSNFSLNAVNNWAISTLILVPNSSNILSLNSSNTFCRLSWSANSPETFQLIKISKKLQRIKRRIFLQYGVKFQQIHCRPSESVTYRMNIRSMWKERNMCFGEIWKIIISWGNNHQSRGSTNCEHISANT